MSLEEAGTIAIKELKKSKSYAGFIGIDSKGLFVAKAVKNYMYFGAR
jgi:isoaspartyl peptidase/L-asparaginase-like protein (Ntn-hydrolase superfamily)